MRFPGFGVHEVEWFFTNKPLIPYETVYNSHNHVREDGDEDGDTGEPGEVWGAPRTYSKGSALPADCCDRPSGSAQAWLGLTDENSPAFLVPHCLTILGGGGVSLAGHGYQPSHRPSGLALGGRGNAGLRGSGGLSWDGQGREVRVSIPHGGIALAGTGGVSRSGSGGVLLDGSGRLGQRGTGGFTIDGLGIRLERGQGGLLLSGVGVLGETGSGGLALDGSGREITMTTFGCSTIVAAGINQGTATMIGNDTVSATSTGAGQGVILPAGCFRVIVRNSNAGGGNPINVYPPSGAKIAALATNQAQVVIAGGCTMFAEITATQWDYVVMT